MNSTEMQAETSNNDEVLAVKGPEQQFLTFIMDGEEYGVDILAVQEIRGWEETTNIPNAPEYIKGVINLRGTIVPIIDLRLRFGIQHVEYSPLTVVIVLKVEIAGELKTFGIVVDAVSDVYSLTLDEMKSPPDLGDGKTEYLKGLVNVSDKMVILLNIERLLNLSDLGLE